MERNKAEEYFKNKLEQRTIKPSKEAWDRLDAMLSVTEGKVAPKNKNRAWLYMAASFIAFLSAGVFLLKNSDQETVIDKNNAVTVKEIQNKPVPETNSQPLKEMPVLQSNGLATKENTIKQIISAPAPNTNQVSGMTTKATLVAENAHKEMGYTTPSNDAETLLADVTDDVAKKRKGIKVDASSLLLTVEGELNDNYRSKTLQGVVKSFNTVKVAVVNRNYE